MTTIHSTIDAQDCAYLPVHITMDLEDSSSYKDAIFYYSVFICGPSYESHRALCIPCKSFDSDKFIDLPYRCNSRATSIVVNVFGNYINDDVGAWPCEHHIGSAVIPLYKEGCSFAPIVSARNRGLGSVCVEMQLQPKDLLTAPLGEFHENRSQVLQLAHDTCQKHFTNMQHFKFNALFGVNVPYFASIYIRGNRIPTIAFLSSLNTLQVKQSTAQSTFKWWLTLARSNVGIPLKTSLSSCTNEEIGEVTCEMFTLYCKALVYSFDGVKTKYGYEPEDQWTPLGMFPHMQNAAYDCEDGMITSCEYLHAFKIATFNDFETDLLFLQRHLNKFRICYTLGLLRKGTTAGADTSSSFILHAYILLIDELTFLSKADRFSKNVMLPIVIETTNYLTSSYADPLSTEITKTEDLNYDIGDNVFNVLCPAGEGENEHWRYALHLKAPLGKIQKQDVYGIIHSIFSIDPVSSEMTHYVMIDSKTDLVGVNAMNCFKGDIDSYEIRKVFALNVKDEKALSLLMCENTIMTLPPPPEIQIAPRPLLKSNRRYILRTLDNCVIKRVMNAIERSTNGKIQQELSVDVFKNCNIVIIDSLKE